MSESNVYAAPPADKPARQVNPKLLAAGGVVALGALGWFVVMPALSGGGSSDAGPVARGVPHVTRTLKHGATTTTKGSAKAAPKPADVQALPATYSGSLGRDPFKPLVPEPAPATTAPAAAPASAPASGSTGSSSGSTAPIRLLLTKLYVGSDKLIHAKIQVNGGTVYDVVQGDVFDSTFKVLEDGDNYATVQYGDSTPRTLQLKTPEYF